MAYRRTERVRQKLEARHAALIAAARSIAAESGLDAVQIAPVAARAGLAAGTVYRYFESKTALVDALLADIADRETEAMRVAANAAPGPLSALAASIVTFAGRAVQQRRLAWAALAEPVDAELARVQQGVRAAISAELAARLAAARAGGFLSDANPALLAPAILGAILEALLGPLATLTPESDAAAGRAAVQVLALNVLRGLRIVDARARGLVVQVPWPVPETTGLPPLRSLNAT